MTSEEMDAFVESLDPATRDHLICRLMWAEGWFIAMSLETNQFLEEVERGEWTEQGLPPGSVTFEEARVNLEYVARKAEFPESEYLALYEWAVEEILQQRQEAACG